MMVSTLPTSFPARCNGFTSQKILHKEPVSRVDDLFDRTGFILLLLTVSTLIVRPADLLPVLTGMHIYEVLVVACIITALPLLLRQLTLSSLRGNSITALALLLIPAAMLSHLSHLDTFNARRSGLELAKNCLAYLLLIGLVKSPRQLVMTLSVVTACVAVEAILALLQYKGVLHLAALQSIVQTSGDSGIGESQLLVRVCGIGVFNDPNDFSLVLVTGMIVCALGLEQHRGIWKRIMLVTLFLLLGYTTILTHSRGGLIAALAAIATLLPARVGWRNASALGLILLPMLAFLLTGREARVELYNPDDTFQTRLELWRESLEVFRSAPCFGIGQDRLADEIGQVTHNSYLHAYTEMGLFGGSAFFGLFFLTIRGLKASEPTDPLMTQLKPYVRAIVASYAVGLLSLSRCYTVPTFMIVALGVSYCVIAGGGLGTSILCFDKTCVRRVFTAGVMMLIATELFVRLMLSGRPT